MRCNSTRLSIAIFLIKRLIGVLIFVRLLALLFNRARQLRFRRQNNKRTMNSTINHIDNNHSNKIGNEGPIITPTEAINGGITSLNIIDERGTGVSAAKSKEIWKKKSKLQNYGVNKDDINTRRRGKSKSATTDKIILHLVKR